VIVERISEALKWAWDQTGGVFLDPGHFLSLAPMLVAFVVALIVISVRLSRKSKHGVPPVRQLLALLFPRRIFLHKSAKLDYGVFCINQGVLFFLTISVFLSPAIVSEVMLNTAKYLGYDSGVSSPTLTQRVVYSIYLILVWDFSATYAHYLKHKIPILWELHKVHHSAEVMTPITALRRHPLEAIFGSIVAAFFIGSATGIWVLVFGQGVMPINLFGTLFGIWLWRVSGYNLRHTHIWISYGNFWNRIFISPAQHQVHHSKSPEHYDTNFGHIFAFWDKLFGTLYLPKFEERVEFGIDDEEMPEYQSLFGLYVTPCVNAWRILTGRPRAHQVERSQMETE
jgi:sterol desaturase/sphingolipid hydroxylase (fatty acid hydroxylase superfamily)